jgi:threonine aldolase
MRQAGVLAAAGIVALESMVDRLADDHARARLLAEGLLEIRGLSLEIEIPPTNMVYIQLTPQAPINAPMLVEALAGKGIKVSSIGAKRMRLVVHHWIDDKAVEYTVESFRQALGSA